MIELPAALAAWAPELAALPGELVAVLVPWLGPLARVTGPMSGRRTDGTGEPDGYHGLARRGSYERLLASEWSVAELYPDEFLRRAVAGEHAFLELAHREPRGARRVVVLLSAGPAQLGAPRLAHLAMLIVLARRAAAAGAQLAWGVLEHASLGLREAVDLAGVTSLLASRSAREAGEEDLQRWRAALGDGEHWFIGDAAGAARVPGLAHAIVEDVLDPAVRALDVTVRHGRVRLALPPDALCARLLRRPLRAPSPRRAVATPEAAIDVRFSSSGRRLLVRLPDDQLESWPIPNSPNQPMAPAQRWRPPEGRVVVAYGASSRAAIAALARPDDPSRLELRNGSSYGIEVVLDATLREALAGWLDRPGARPVGGLGATGPLHVGLAFQIGAYLGHTPAFDAWPPHGTVLEAKSLTGAEHDPIYTCAFRRRGVAWAEYTGRSAIVRAVSAQGIVRGPVLPVERAGELFFGPSGSGGTTPWGTVAGAASDTTWIVFLENERHVLETELPVLGAYAAADDTPGLLVRVGPRQLALSDRTLHLLPAEPHDIVQALMCPQQDVVAWRTAAEVVVYSLRHRAVLLRRVAGG